MESGYYLCKVRVLNLLHKEVYEGKILYWNGTNWLDKEDSFFVTDPKTIKCSIKIPDKYYETIVK